MFITCSPPSIVQPIGRLFIENVVTINGHLKVHRHDESNETHAQVTAIIYDCERRCFTSGTRGNIRVFTTSNQYELEIVLNNPYDAKELYLLIKPVIS